MSTVPGLNALHAVITPTCRENKTDIGAFNEVVKRLRKEYLTCLKGRGEDGSQYHVVLSVEPPAVVEKERSPTDRGLDHVD